MTAVVLDDFDRAVIEALPTLLIHCKALTKRSSVDAEDLAQDTVLSALRHRDSFQAGSHMRGWLKIIARNRFFSTLRKASHIPKGVALGDWGDLDENPWDEALAGGVLLPFPATQHDRVEAAQALAAVDQLSPKLREAMTDIIDEATTEESAKARQIPIATVRTRRCRARDAMREHFGLPRLMAAR